MKLHVEYGERAVKVFDEHFQRDARFQEVGGASDTEVVATSSYGGGHIVDEAGIHHTAVGIANVNAAYAQYFAAAIGK